MMNKNHLCDLNKLFYCERHNAHWSPPPTASEVGSTCPWCRSDVYYDELENIYDVFKTAILSKEMKGGQQVPYHGDFASVVPSTLRDMKYYITRWAEVLGKNAKRGV